MTLSRPDDRLIGVYLGRDSCFAAAEFDSRQNAAFAEAWLNQVSLRGSQKEASGSAGATCFGY